jgi:coenzyme Q-binding protein COQ10
MTFCTTRIHVNYTDSQLFDLVADVERFPEFLPWVIAAKVIRSQDTTIWTNMTMGTSFLSKRFTTVALLKRPHRIDISCRDPMFQCFEQRWRFEPAGDGGTFVEYQVDFRFQSNVLQALIGGSFGERSSAMVNAFKRRAQKLYGVPSPSKSYQALGSDNGVTQSAKGSRRLRAVTADADRRHRAVGTTP